MQKKLSKSSWVTREFVCRSGYASHESENIFNIRAKLNSALPPMYIVHAIRIHSNPYNIDSGSRAYDASAQPSAYRENLYVQMLTIISVKLVPLCEVYIHPAVFIYRLRPGQWRQMRKHIAAISTEGERCAGKAFAWLRNHLTSSGSARVCVCMCVGLCARDWKTNETIECCVFSFASISRYNSGLYFNVVTGTKWTFKLFSANSKWINILGTDSIQWKTLSQSFNVQT